MKKKKSEKTAKPAQSAVQERAPKDFPIVGIGSSAGGLEATTALLKALPAKTGMAYVVVPHLDPMHQSAYTEILGRATSLPVMQVKDGTEVKPDNVYVIPPNCELTVSDGTLRLKPREFTRGQHMPIDAFLRSLAQERGSMAVGVVLSGTASDGTLGLGAIKGEGGITFAQDSKSAKYDGMPASAVEAGCVDFVLPPEIIAQELARIGQHPYIAGARREQVDEPIQPRDATYAEIFRMLYRASKVDFSEYKPATIRRRIMRRMAVNKVDSLREYLSLLHRNRNEVTALYGDILINVTSFFRNAEVFDSMKLTVFPALVRGREPQETIRIWVPGCSTGEEPYSLAIALLEFFEEQRMQHPVQVFGTDLSPAAVQKARLGMYRENIRQDLSPQRLRRFFNKQEDGYQISKSIRELCIFSTQNVFADPPFSHMDLVSCRNVLIYLSPVLQKRVVPIFHYALNPEGFLLIGNSEGLLGAGSELFDMVDRRNKIYRRRPGPSPVAFGMSVQRTEMNGEVAGGEISAPPREQRPPSDLLRESDRLLLSRYAPPAVVVSNDLDILQTRGHTARYLELPAGKASLSLLKMAKPGLLYELQSAIEEARHSGLEVRRKVPLEVNGGDIKPVDISVLPFRAPLQERFSFLIVFEEPDQHPEQLPTAQAPETPEEVSAREKQIGQLKQELSASKEYLQSIIEQLEATNEELQSANEEIQSGNEELQSTNEELQTSKEELESANEELNTVNEEMQHRNELLTQLNNDLTNLLNVGIPMVMLGPNLIVRRYTPQAESVLGLTAADVGHPLTRLKLKINIADLEHSMLLVMREGTARRDEIHGPGGHMYRVHLTPYTSMDNRTEGVVMTLLDITDLKASAKDKGKNRGK